MSSNNKHFKYIDILRIFSCIMIFLYHLNMLKGGFLAVSIFFVISGYLSTIKLFKKEKISFKEFYLNKLFRLYLPMLIVVFVSIGVIKLFLDVNWFNLKPEVTSIMLGYNNFWQIMTNMDYFRSGLESPFIHLWYMAILMQFDLVFPFIFLLLKKIGDKSKMTKKNVRLNSSQIYAYFLNLQSFSQSFFLFLCPFLSIR